MKTNKKVILGFAMAMIFSLALMQGVATTSNKQNVSLQQVSAGCAYMAGESEGGEAAAWYAAAAMSGGVAVNVATGGSFLWWNPVGWGAFGVAAGAAL
ncbi:MAG: hypothetical protein PSN34_08770 [Urechidicola sp.]|nr:hypothetical protein [Urechidicola sp.]